MFRLFAPNFDIVLLVLSRIQTSFLHVVHLSALIKMPLTRELVSDIKDVFKDCLEEMLKCEDFIQRLSNRLSQNINKKVEEAVKTYMDRCEQLEIQNKMLLNKIDTLEQHTRRNNIRIQGIAEDSKEDLGKKLLNLFNEKLNVNVVQKDFDSIYRIGSNSNNAGMSRPIIVKCTNSYIKNEILKNRKKLKGSKTFLCEDLSLARYKLYRAAQEKYGKKFAWTINGDVKVKAGSVIKKIRSLNDLD